MVDVMDALAAAAVIAAITLGFVALGLSLNLKAARRELSAEKMANEAISNRLEVVKQDNRDLEREVGRVKAEKVAMKPKRDPVTGRFIPKAKA